MHIFGGERPEGEARAHFIHAAARFNNALSKALFADSCSPENVELLRERESAELAFVRAILSGSNALDAVHTAVGRPPLPGTEDDLFAVAALILTLNTGINETNEIRSLLHGISGGFIPPGPSADNPWKN